MKNSYKSILRVQRTLLHLQRRAHTTPSQPNSTYGELNPDGSEDFGEARVHDSQFISGRLPNSDVFSFVFRDVRKWQRKTFAECGLSGQHYTYGEAVSGALRFAGLVRKLTGGQPSPTVAFLAPNSPGLLLMYCGCFAAGATISPINPLYTPAEVAGQLMDSGASVLVVDSWTEPSADAALELMAKSPIPVIVNGPSVKGRLNAQQLFLDQDIPMVEPAEIDPSSTAFLPYSSGTTGNPKGVRISHAAITNNLSMLANRKFHQIRPALGEHQDLQLGILPFFHIYGLMATFLPSVLYGVKLVTLPKFDPTLFVSVIKKHQMSSLQAVPPLVQFIADCPMISSRDLETLHSISVGAAPLSKYTAGALKNKISSLVLQEGYGMTESLITHLTPFGEESIGHCGKLLPNVQAKVLDSRTGALLPPGKPGELWVKTPGLMTGYHNNDDATNESIVDGWLNTGDVAVCSDDGFFRIVDRVKELIKVKGLQVSPSEIEKGLMELEGVQDAGVTSVPDPKLGEAPVAFVVRSDEAVDERVVSSFMKRRFAAHKQLAGGVHFVDSLPKNHLGKLLRRKLKDMI